jgi:MarR family 2-MHQ and catechol resistance regulon transcriptional repressor
MAGTASPIDDDRITSYGLMVEASRRLQRTFERTLRETHGLSTVAFEALLRIGRSEGRQMSMSDLGAQMVLTSGGVTRLVDRLEGAGLVERHRCAEDRRVQWAQLTERGLELAEAATRTHLADLEDHFVSEMSPDEYATVTSVMDRLRSGCPVTDLR